MRAKDFPDIIYTKVDEAPELASASPLPIIKAFTKRAGITISTMDISLAGRIIANFPEALSEDQIISDDLADLGKIVLEPRANVIKLPNISASIPQLISAIIELQGQGYNIPNYPEFPVSIKEEEIKARYDLIKGSAVNPVLREGNSDRRAAKAVKRYAMKNPHSMGTWNPYSKTKVSSMDSGDFYSNEVSKTVSHSQVGLGQIVFENADRSSKKILKENLYYEEGTIVDATFLSVVELRKFVKENDIKYAMINPESAVLEWSLYKKNGGVWPCKTILPDYDVVKVLMNKGKMTSILKNSGLVPKSFVFSASDLDFYKLEKKLTYPFWIRSTYGSSGLGSLKVENRESLKNWLIKDIA